jgi:hypothetical protein
MRTQRGYTSLLWNQFDKNMANVARNENKMKPIEKNIIINSTMLFVIASILTMTLHEFGHFLASILVHARQISIHHNYTSNSGDGLSLISTVIIKGTGPFVSLIIGIFFHFICSRQIKRNVLFVFHTYMSLFGYIGFFGYLIIAPLTPGGDTGYILYSLNFPVWMMVVLAIIGAIVLYFLINDLMRYFVEMGSKEIIENAEGRMKFIRALIYFPLIIGIILTTLLNLPVPIMISLIAPICGSLTILCGYDNASKKDYSLKNINKEFEQFNRFNFLSFGFFVLTIILNRLLVYGIYVR